YVKIVGMTNLEDVDPADEARTYRQKSFRQRVAVAVAGSTMHFLMALALIVVALVWVGQPNGSIDPRVHWKDWQIASVRAATGAAVAGLREGDRILSIDGPSTDTFEDVRSVTEALADQTVPVVYERDGVDETVDVTLRPRYQWFIARVAADTPPAEVGLEPGDEIVRIDDLDVDGVKDMASVLEDVEGEEITVSFLRREGDGVREHTVDLVAQNLMLQGNQVLVGIS